VLEVIDSNSKTPTRDRAIILLAFNSGIRCVDIRNLKLLDLDWKKQELRIVQKKTGKPIIAPLNGKTLNAIADYILSEDNCVFIRAYPPYTGIASTSPLDYMIDKYCRLADVEKSRTALFIVYAALLERNSQRQRSLLRPFPRCLATVICHLEKPISALTERKPLCVPQTFPRFPSPRVSMQIFSFHLTATWGKVVTGFEFLG